MNYSPFFIIGGQRSGTTLLRLMLNNHSKIAVPEEGTFWMPLLRRELKTPSATFDAEQLKNTLDYLTHNGQFSLWRLDIESLISTFKKFNTPRLKDIFTAVYSLAADKDGKDAWGDKTPSFFRMVPVLAAMFPESRFVHIVRDGRDVYLSQRNMGIRSRNVSSAAIEWKFKVDTARNDLRNNAKGRFLELRFEDLLTATETNLRLVSDFLEITWEKEMLAYWKTSKNHIGPHHSKAIFQPVDPTQAGRWRNEMTTREIRRFELLTKATLKAYGYPVEESGTAGLVDGIAVGMEMISGIPRRALEIARTKRDLDRSAQHGLQTDAAGSGSSGKGKD